MGEGICSIAEGKTDFKNFLGKIIRGQLRISFSR